MFSAHQCPSYQHFLAGKCFGCKSGAGSCALMGYHADSTPGLENEVSPQIKLHDLVGNKYFTTTGREFPYCRKFIYRTMGVYTTSTLGKPQQKLTHSHFSYLLQFIG